MKLELQKSACIDREARVRHELDEASESSVDRDARLQCMILN